VAPFEADAQIAFLQQNGFADIAISEDSDSLVYGCDQVVFLNPAKGRFISNQAGSHSEKA
jgi:exonuclease-1